MKDEVTLRVLGILGILFVVYGITIRGYYGFWENYSYLLASFGAVLTLGSLYFFRDLSEKGKSIPVKVGLTAMAIVLVGMIGEIFVLVWILKKALLGISFYFYWAMDIAIPFLLIALLVKKYRKKAVIPSMIACGLSAIKYFFVFQDLGETIYFLETLICLVIFAISYVLYAYLS